MALSVRDLILCFKELELICGDMPLNGIVKTICEEFPLSGGVDTMNFSFELVHLDALELFTLLATRVYRSRSPAATQSTEEIVEAVRPSESGSGARTPSSSTTSADQRADETSLISGAGREERKRRLTATSIKEKPSERSKIGDSVDKKMLGATLHAVHRRQRTTLSTQSPIHAPDSTAGLIQRRPSRVPGTTSQKEWPSAEQHQPAPRPISAKRGKVGQIFEAQDKVFLFMMIC
ncbi:unnamed protein product [Protopolystoma xenopodis]|uniref:Uncharacterized protein n=1 Tax=Protopolystoma xenopodis TaxID=117903 RepID=A0A448WLY7_9PLAT|nr:unnamed protein product [Protopolystoma xenopodis]